MGVFTSLASEPLSGTVSTLTCYYWCVAPLPLLGCSPLVSTWYSGEGTLEKTCPHCREERGYAQRYQNIKVLMNSWRVSGKSLRVPLIQIKIRLNSRMPALLTTMPWCTWGSPAFQANIDLSTSEIWIWPHWPQPGYIATTGFGAFNPNVDNIFYLAVNNDMTPFQNAVSLFRDRHFDTRADREPPFQWQMVNTCPLPYRQRSRQNEAPPHPLA